MSLLGASYWARALDKRNEARASQTIHAVRCRWPLLAHQQLREAGAARRWANTGGGRRRASMGKPCTVKRLARAPRKRRLGQLGSARLQAGGLHVAADGHVRASPFTRRLGAHLLSAGGASSCWCRFRRPSASLISCAVHSALASRRARRWTTWCSARCAVARRGPAVPSVTIVSTVLTSARKGRAGRVCASRHGS